MSNEISPARAILHSPLPADVTVLHVALDNLLAAFIPLHGTQHTAVEAALKALAMHYQDLPTNAGSRAIIEARGYGMNKSEE